MREQFVKPRDGMRGNAQEYVMEPGERVHLRQLAGRDKAAQDRCRSAAAVAAEKRPVVAAYRPATQRPLGVVVIDR